jgi:hypothetical protein
MQMTHHIEYAPSAPSEVFVPAGPRSGPSQVVAGTEPLLVAGTVSEVTIQPGLEVAPHRASRRAGTSLSAGGAHTGSSGVCRH